MKRSYFIFKRIFDFVFSLFILIFIWPLLLIISIIIKIESKGPVFFKQIRIGQYKNPFIIIKFRTMYQDTPKDIPTHLLVKPELHVTKFGNFLRMTSLDELPQLINILKGEMSFVGPRPALWNQDDLIIARDRYHVNNMIPGLTGWAQINGRDKIDIPTKALFDGYYVQNCSLWLDIKIIIITIWRVLCRDGIINNSKAIFNNSNNMQNDI